MRRPELDLALVCEEVGLAPTELVAILGRRRDGLTLKALITDFPTVRDDVWSAIVAIAESAGAIHEIEDDSKPPEERGLCVRHDDFVALTRDACAILGSLPELRRILSTDVGYRVAATIPDKLASLREFFTAFEDTALGIRRMIGAAQARLTFLVPFMDSEGIAEISPSLGKALQVGVEVVFLSRDLGKGGRNLEVLSTLVESLEAHAGRLVLYEAVTADSTPFSHAKVVSRDGGAEVYVGSANLTGASMERTIEIGAFLRGAAARPVDHFLALVRSQSRQRWP